MSGVTGIDWDEIAVRLGAAHYYWVHTTGPDGAPDASPVWGVVNHDILYMYTFRSSVKARNLARDPRLVVHLESGSDVTIVHGSAVDMGLPTEHPDIVEAFEAKYRRPEEAPFLPSSDPGFDVLYSIQPRRALVWALPDSEASTRRWAAARGT